jgi:DNA-binding response OmpR family regulator
MPEIDGSQVLTKIREPEREKQITDKFKVRIIMVSGVSEKEMVMACRRDCCDDFLVKPIEIRLLFNKIKNIGLLPQEN